MKKFLLKYKTYFIILLIILIILAINIISKKNQILSDIEEKEDK